jgi:hypothetical protein
MHASNAVSHSSTHCLIFDVGLLTVGAGGAGAACVGGGAVLLTFVTGGGANALVGAGAASCLLVSTIPGAACIIASSVGSSGLTSA